MGMILSLWFLVHVFDASWQHVGITQCKGSFLKRLSVTTPRVMSISTDVKSLGKGHYSSPSSPRPTLVEPGKWHFPSLSTVRDPFHALDLLAGSTTDRLL